jgi:7-cyano-7-deazaguanine synthase
MSAAVVLLSGGLDSATTLAMARSEGHACRCLSIDYGQRHRSELEAARKIAIAFAAVEHRVIALDLTAFGGSALTDVRIQVPTDGVAPGIPVTYVPARNTIFLSLALAYAEASASQHIFFGANAVDYSGYPDCRPEYMRAFQMLANVATKAAVDGSSVELHTPIIALNKADIIRRGIALGVDYALTVSCYQATEEGLACGACDSCRLRRAGFEAAGVTDPTRYAARARRLE